ncbi:hypothetical protein IQ249_11910 [Lusitaniella coriacea LEGE 07157]|uniref:Uncharacterized protein n=1 Tax=Lusitaniella coriacea LEGE 07157 TaxID=945747 RepID=A0A8J7JAW9_9CYAN|nr:hypothetical protein [Lusitaniella coriacea]MBE9116605.1 hypothetical protein [Lusitaniella coriacea LEGE 07157]
MSIESNLKILKEYNIEIKGTVRNKIRARHLDWMIENLETGVAMEVFEILIQDRNDRASINQLQSQDITRKAGEIHQLNQKNLQLEQEVSYWKKVADDLNQLFEQFQNLAIDTTDALYQQLVYKIGERSEICRGVKKLGEFYREAKVNHNF